MKIALIGHGWLGHLFKRYLMDTYPKQFEFFLTRNLNSDSESMAFNINNDEVPKELRACDFIFFLIPPSKCDSYPLAIQKVLKAKNKKARFILISSTSVFSNNQKECDESTPPQPESQRSINISEAERVALEAHQWVIRSGGQYGANRHPVTFLAKKTQIEGGLNPVNMIHSSDLVRILALPIFKDDCPQIIHAVSPHHQSKEDFYTNEANKLSLKLPPFLREKSSSKKVIPQYLRDIDFKFLNPRGI